jgi:hypothetical protein
MSSPVKCCRFRTEDISPKVAPEVQYDKTVLNLLRPRSALAFFSLLILMPAFGCAKKAFVVEVPQGFVGYVHVNCGSTIGFPAQPVRVNALGGADSESCPGSDAEVKVLRNGTPATAIAIDWQRTGDGTPVALSFNVK